MGRWLQFDARVRDGDRRRRRGGRLLVVAGAAVALLVPLMVRGGVADLAALFAQARYDEATSHLEAEPLPASRPAEDLLWQVRLSNDPDETIELCRTALRDTRLLEAVRCQFVLQLTTVEYGRGRYVAALEPLLALVDDHKEPLPGEVHLLAGLCYRALGEEQRSREMFASVRAHDPAFAWARYYLGSLGIEQGDLSLATRYFESAARSELAGRMPLVQAGIWEAMRLDGQTASAAALRDRVQEEFPTSLAVLQIQEILRREAAELPVSHLAHGDTIATPVPAPATGGGRISLQLAAFRDRSRALAFLARWQGQLPELRIDEVNGELGQRYYKIRTGYFVSRAEAHTAGQHLQRTHGLESITVESGR